MSLNVVVLSGRLGNDPNLRSTSGGTSVCGFNLAVDRGYGDKKKTVWISVEAWGKTAEAVSRLVQKGKRIQVTGELDQESWEKDGNKHTRMKVVANKIDIIDFVEKGESQETNSDDDDIPF